MSLKLTPEEIVLLDKFAAAALTGWIAFFGNDRRNLEGGGQHIECDQEFAFWSARRMICERRKVLAEHADPTVKDSLSVEPMPEGGAQ